MCVCWCNTTTGWWWILSERDEIDQPRGFGFFLISGPPVEVGVTMYVLSISSVSEVLMVQCPLYSLHEIHFAIVLYTYISLYIYHVPLFFRLIFSPYTFVTIYHHHFFFYCFSFFFFALCERYLYHIHQFSDYASVLRCITYYCVCVRWKHHKPFLFCVDADLYTQHAYNIYTSRESCAHWFIIIYDGSRFRLGYKPGCLVRSKSASTVCKLKFFLFVFF